MSFQGAYWAPAPDAPDWAGRAAQALNQDQGTRKTLQSLLNDTCPQFARGLLEAGKSELEKQGEPASATPAPHSSAPAGAGPDFTALGSCQGWKAQEGMGEAQGYLFIPQTLTEHPLVSVN